MPVPVSGSVAVAIEAVAAYLSLCETLQAGRSAAETLEDSIDWGYRPTPAGERKPARPFAVVDVTNGHRYSLDSGGDQNYLRPAGKVWLWLEYDWPAAYLTDPLNARREAASWFGNVIDELAALAGQDISDRMPPFSDGGGSLSITAITQEVLAVTDPDDTPEGEVFFIAGYSIDWGDG